MLVTLSGITVLTQPTTKLLSEVRIMALQLFRESYIGLDGTTVKNANCEQPENALFPMIVTLSGIVTETRPEQPEKADVTMSDEPDETTAFVMDL